MYLDIGMEYKSNNLASFPGIYELIQIYDVQLYLSAIAFFFKIFGIGLPFHSPGD